MSPAPAGGTVAGAARPIRWECLDRDDRMTIDGW